MRRKLLCMVILILVLAIAVQPAMAESKAAKTKTVWVIDSITNAFDEAEVMTIKYNKKGLVKSYVSSIENSGINYTYSYNSKNQLTKLKKEIAPGTVYITKYEYSNNKLVRSYESNEPFSKNAAVKTTYKWSKKNGNYVVKIKSPNYSRTLTLKKDYSLSKSTGSNITVINKFNKKGYLTSVYYKATDATTRYKYTEDSKGNITTVQYKGEGSDSYRDFKYLHYKKIKVPAANYDLVKKQQRYLMEWTCPLWMLNNME